MTDETCHYVSLIRVSIRALIGHSKTKEEWSRKREDGKTVFNKPRPFELRPLVYDYGNLKWRSGRAKQPPNVIKQTHQCTHNTNMRQTSLVRLSVIFSYIFSRLSSPCSYGLIYKRHSC